RASSYTSDALYRADGASYTVPPTSRTVRLRQSLPSQLHVSGQRPSPRQSASPELPLPPNSSMLPDDGSKASPAACRGDGLLLGVLRVHTQAAALPSNFTVQV